MKKQKKVEDPNPKEIVTFRFAYYENAQRVAMAFALANSPVTVSQDAGFYEVHIERYVTKTPKK